MPHGADLKTIRREIAFSAILITGMLFDFKRAASPLKC